MDKFFDRAYNHPIITVVFVSSVLGGIANVIGAIRGVPVQGSGIYITKSVNKGQK